MGQLLQQTQHPPTPAPPAGPPRPDALPGPYVTQLSPAEEIQFRLWASDPKNNALQYIASQRPDYDMRGFWKAMISGNPLAQRGANLHFPDVWKTPYHRSFSAESEYATPAAPHWEGSELIDPHGNTVWDEKWPEEHSRPKWEGK